MLSLSIFFWGTVIVAIISFWWQSDKVKILALAFVDQHCKKQQLQLLDQPMVLKGGWPVRDELEILNLRRRYHFEFSSTGEIRYQGIIVLHGHTLKNLELEPHVIPTQEDSLH